MNYLYKLLCCFNSLSANSIEVLIIILSIISIIINILGLVIIPWKYTLALMKVLYIICLILLIYSLLISSINLSSRNSKAKKPKKIYLAPSFFALLACIISLLIFIAIAIVIIPDLKNEKQVKNVQVLDPETGEYHTRTSTEENLVSNGKMIFVIASLIINIILLVILIFLWISEYIRIKYNINGSYNEYLEETKSKLSENSKISTGNVIGHDKYGLPIYMKPNGGNFRVKSSNLNYFSPISEKRTNYDIENYDILKYSYKEKYDNNFQKPNNKSVEVNYRKYNQKEKYIDKYFDSCEISQKYNPNYFNFTNKTMLNFTDANNSINPGK
jgi:hypothetical protein